MTRPDLPSLACVPVALFSASAADSQTTLADWDVTDATNPASTAGSSTSNGLIVDWN